VVEEQEHLVQQDQQLLEELILVEAEVEVLVEVLLQYMELAELVDLV
jgi:hypothetical protein